MQIVYFFLTVIIEMIIVRMFFRKNSGRIFFYVFLINLITWPIANILYATLFGNAYAFVVIEAGVVATETFLLKILVQTTCKRAFLVSLTANAASAMAGILLGLYAASVF
jgi:hypothetical protein